MAQQHFKFGTYQAPDPDEDGYQPVFTTTSSDSSARTMRGVKKNPVIYTEEAYTMKWTNIAATDAKNILAQIMGKKEFDFYHFNLYTCAWETSKFYVESINTPIIRLNEGKERLSELNFQLRGINPVNIV